MVKAGGAKRREEWPQVTIQIDADHAGTAVKIERQNGLKRIPTLFQVVADRLVVLCQFSAVVIDPQRVVTLDQITITDIQAAKPFDSHLSDTIIAQQTGIHLKSRRTTDAQTTASVASQCAALNDAVGNKIVGVYSIQLKSLHDKFRNDHVVDLI